MRPLGYSPNGPAKVNTGQVDFYGSNAMYGLPPNLRPRAAAPLTYAISQSIPASFVFSALPGGGVSPVTREY